MRVSFASVKIMKSLIFLYFIIVVANAGATETPRIFCGETPQIIYSCIGNPKIIRSEVSTKCDSSASECDKMKCIFKESGWLDGDKVEKEKVSDYFDQFAKDYSEWLPAVQHLKVACLTQDLPAQGVYLNCAAYDVMHCIITSFIRHASPSQWSASSSCAHPHGYAGACPVCPSSCFAPAVPYGSCNACLSLPRSP